MLSLNNGRDSLPFFVCQKVAMGARNFRDDTMGSEKAQAMSGTCRKAPLGLGVMLTWKEVVPNIPVSKSLDVELSSADRFQEPGILLGPRVKGAEPLTFPMGGVANRLNDFPQEAVYLNRSEGVQVAFIGSLTELSPAMEVGHSFAHSLPGRGALGVPFFGAVNFKVPGVVQGGLDAQNAPFLVIDFDGVGLEFMFQADAFGALDIMTDDLSLEIPMGFLAPETEDILAAKSGNAAAHQSRIDLRQGRRGFKHQARSPFTLVGGPIVVRAVGS